MQRLERFLWLAAISVLASGTIWAQPLATGHSKFLGSIYSTAQAPNLTSYFNQVTPENAGKWGSVEVSRGVMNWTELDAAYALAKSNGLPFRFHVLVWGSQQPGWIETLTPAEQLEEIEEWFDAVAARYPDIDYLEVVNEPINQPPDRVGRGNYIGALGGAGATGWDWVIKAFEMARAKFPSKTKLMLNEYSVTTETARMNAYVEIVNLLKARDLIDAVGVQGHSFSHDPAYTTPASTKANLDLLWATEVPIMVTEFDIDGPTDQSQLTRYQNYFPVFWEHPGIIGMTLWGYRPGMWRATANLVTADYTERPAMTWLREYLKTETPTIRAGQRFSVVEGWENGHVIGAVRATDSDPETTFSGWTLTGGSGVGVFAIDADTGRLTLTNARALNAATKPSYTLEVRVSDGVNTSEVGTVTVNVLPEDAVPTRLVALATRAAVGNGQPLTMGFVVNGPKEVLLRGVGPGIAKLGVNTAITDPELELHEIVKGWPVSLGGNDDWESTPVVLAAFARTGAAALDEGSKDAALLMDVAGNPGVYTAGVKSNAGAGVALVDAFDAGGSGRLAALATLATAGSGDDTLIAGLVLDGVGPRTVLIRALGPTLASRDGVTGILADPKLILYRGTTELGGNDDWGGTAEIRRVMAQVGAGRLDSGKDAALLVTLDPGAYTVHVRGAAGTTGVALVEVFDVP